MSDTVKQVRPGFRCTCYYHAPELHGAGGCRVVSWQDGPCSCAWDGVGDPDELVIPLQDGSPVGEEGG